MILKKLFEMIKSIFAFDLYEIEQELIAYLSNGSALPKPLDTDEEQFLIDRLPDEEAKSKLIEHNLRLVVYIAKKFENSGQDVEDLISVGAVGLIKAVQSFNNEKNIKLATYASRCIENEILMHLRKTTRQKLEISLDEPLSYDKDGNELLLSDILVSDEESVTKGMENSVEKQLLKNALKTLPPKEQEIINLRFGLMGQEECTQKQVADILGISQSYISRIEKKILLKLRRDINKYS